jgi:hypothetical protein
MHVLFDQYVLYILIKRLSFRFCTHTHVVLEQGVFCTLTDFGIPHRL